MYSDAKITDPIERKFIARQAIAKKALILLPELEKRLAAFTGKAYTVNSAKTKAIEKLLDGLLEGHFFISKSSYSKTAYITLKAWHVFGKNYDNQGEYSHDDGQYNSFELAIFDVNSDGKIERLCIDSALEYVNYELSLSLSFIKKQLAKKAELEEQLKNLSIPYWALKP